MVLLSAGSLWHGHAAVPPGTAMTVKEMGPAVATRWAFFVLHTFAFQPIQHKD
jgi:hypothetical protein